MDIIEKMLGVEKTSRENVSLHQFMVVFRAITKVKGQGRVITGLEGDHEEQVSYKIGSGKLLSVDIQEDLIFPDYDNNYAAIFMKQKYGDSRLHIYVAVENYEFHVRDLPAPVAYSLLSRYALAEATFWIE